MPAILAIAPEARSDAQKAELAKHYRSLDPSVGATESASRCSAEQQKNERLTGAKIWPGP